jgi:hypothetical protein
MTSWTNPWKASLKAGHATFFKGFFGLGKLKPTSPPDLRPGPLSSRRPLYVWGHLLLRGNVPYCDSHYLRYHAPVNCIPASSFEFRSLNGYITLIPTEAAGKFYLSRYDRRTKQCHAQEMEDLPHLPEMIGLAVSMYFSLPRRYQ